MSWCSARQFLLSHMPSFDLQFLPGPRWKAPKGTVAVTGAVSVEGASMLDDNIAFALMAARWNSHGPPALQNPPIRPSC